MVSITQPLVNRLNEYGVLCISTMTNHQYELNWSRCSFVIFRRFEVIQRVEIVRRFDIFYWFKLLRRFDRRHPIWWFKFLRRFDMRHPIWCDKVAMVYNHVFHRILVCKKNIWVINIGPNCVIEIRKIYMFPKHV